MKDLSSTLELYGADIGEGFLNFTETSPELLPYATLVAARDQDDSPLKALWGVYEWQSSPLVFLVNGDEIEDDKHFQHIRRCFALRGDAPYMGVVRPGQLTVHRISLDKNDQKTSQLKNLPNDDTRGLFPYLANSRPDIASTRKWISSIVLKLLRDAIRELRDQNIGADDAISLTGRALFLRFLADRELLPPKLGAPEQIFNDACRAKNASCWLDVTFNGDFLPLSDGLFAEISHDALLPLGNILHRAEGGQLHLGWQEKWDYLDFAHIPVGVLSETYEHYMREHDRKKQRKEGSFYTPRAIADLMVSASFHALRRDGKSADAKVLDPAAGAGVFLVSAFRQLVMERWIHDNKRPDTKTLREILYNQVVGFDINEAALRFAALGLYLMSIELDPEPEPVEKLIFNKDLRGAVLHELSNGVEGGLGSLGTAVSASHVGQYDLVIGNPPWPGDTKLKGWPEVKGIVDSVARNRLPESAPPPIPNEVLDLPFVWRAMEWAKPSGQITFALHARVLFQQGNGMVEARSALFRAISISSIINGAELRNSRVWPEITAPFCLLFAKNQLPAVDAAFRFVTPHLEEGLNGAGTMRIDAANAELLMPSQITECPEILKTLFRGNTLDLEIFDRLKSRELVPLEQYWRKTFGERKGRAKNISTGYQRVCNSTKNPQSSDHLLGKPDLPSNADLSVLIDVNDLDLFCLPSLHRARDPEAYKGPLLIVHKSPPTTNGRIRVSMSEDDLVYNEVYYGYSGKAHSLAIPFIRYLTLLLGSKPAFWYVLMTSGEFGFEREVVEKIIIDNIPIIPFEALDSTALEQIDPLFDALVLKDSPENWAKVDVWAASLYGLREQDLQVIDDTLRYNLPFSSNKKTAQKPPSQNEVVAFCSCLKNELTPWAQREEKVIEVQTWKSPLAFPWTVFRVSATTAGNNECSLSTEDWPEVLRVADRLASTEVILPDADTNSLWIARLNQARYWSKSQARLVARRIAWEHLDVLFGGDVK